MNATEKYDAALAVAREASRVFAKAQAAYRAGEIGDAEFLAARTAFKASDVAFDKAECEFIAECNK